MRVNEDKVYRLFDAIGELDPRVVDEALKYKRTGVRTRRFFTVLVAACVAFSILIVGSVGLMMVNQKNDANADSFPNNSVEDGRTDIAELLSGSTSHSTFDSVELIGAQSTIVWQESGEDSYNVLVIDGRDCEKLVSLMKNSKGERVDESYTESVKVWITCGDGSVISPYLTYSEGNVGYGALFEYDPEIEPDENFVEELKKLIP